MLLTNLIYHVCSIFSHAHVPSPLVTFPSLFRLVFFVARKLREESLKLAISFVGLYTYTYTCLLLLYEPTTLYIFRPSRKEVFVKENLCSLSLPCFRTNSSAKDALGQHRFSTQDSFYSFTDISPLVVPQVSRVIGSRNSL